MQRQKALSTQTVSRRSRHVLFWRPMSVQVGLLNMAAGWAWWHAFSHPSLTAPSMQNCACATGAAARGQLLFWESRGARDAMIAQLCELVWIWVSAKSLRGKMTILTAFSDIVALFNTSLLSVLSGKMLGMTRQCLGVYMMPVSIWEI